MTRDPRSHADGPTTTSTSLVLRIQSHDAVAWERFARVYGPLVYSWCRQQKLQPADAEDVSQEVLRSVVNKIRLYERTGSFRGWMWQVTRNKIIDHARRNGRNPHAIGGTDFAMQLHELPEAPPDEDASGDGKFGIEVLRALELIKADCEPASWTAFWRMAVEGHSAAEIAADLGWSGATPDDAARGTKRVRQAKHRILQRLKTEFGEILDLP